ncbi:uncharacterized protein LOC126989323 isoform X2 [Eriocheir sinensis]|uniref:uncharacterized protein LOC126989323 isoform X2 n=1 Tax=Eriocheir sinensis TaxID=95602 RepID=UPI0021C9F57D|nr:uncharacterized protein LOC126989323 isoform X2 [Eriocheir sinensis]
MILSKDLQEILEGVHYFLAEALQKESLSGRAECLRRGLILQLEGLAGVYPTLRIQPGEPGGGGGLGGAKGPGSATSLPYLAMNQSGNTTTSTPSLLITPTTTTTTNPYSTTSSSSGVNSSGNSSRGSSGDGFVGGRPLGGGTSTPTTTTTTLDSGGGDDMEMYEAFDEFTEDEIVESSSRPGGGGGGGGKEEEEKEEDGVYTETEEVVSFSSLIASCERHGPLGKKTKGLLRNVKTYQCVATGGCLYLFIKDSDDRQRKTIDLTGYTARPATGEEIKDTRKRDAAFEMVCPGKKTHTFIARTAKDKNEWLTALDRTIRSGRSRPSIVPPPAPGPAPPSHQFRPQKPTHQPPQPSEEYKYYHDVAEEIQEEVEPEDTPCSKGPPPRPPPPNLPTQPSREEEGEDSDDGIYCEIDEDTLEEARQNYSRGFMGAEGGSGGSAGSVGSGSKLKLPLPQPPSHSTSPSTPPTPTPTHMGKLTEEVFSRLSNFAAQPQPPNAPGTPPRLPPKGVPAPESDDSEYKVPMGANMEYQVPTSHPVQFDQSKGGKGTGGGLSGQKTDKITARLAMRAAGEEGDDTEAENGCDSSDVKKGGIGVISSPLLPPPPKAEVLPIKTSLERKPPVKDEKKAVSSFLGRGDKAGGNGGDSCPAPHLRSGPSASVKDMIARLNQNRTQQPPPTSPASSPTPSPTPPATKIPALPKQHLIEKPATPPRPPYLRGDSPQPPKKEEEVQEKEEQEEEELYAELEDVSPGGGGGGGGEEETEGEWYVAKFAFVATLPQAMSFGRGDELLVYDRSGDSGWWRAKLRGKNGLIPREYVRKKD